MGGWRERVITHASNSISHVIARRQLMQPLCSQWRIWGGGGGPWPPLWQMFLPYEKLGKPGLVPLGEH